MDSLEQLESEAIYIYREIAGQFANPVILFSGGKDSTVLIHLAEKAFFPMKIPFPVMHVDTGHNFAEVLKFRDSLVNRKNLHLIVKKVTDTISNRKIADMSGKFPSRNFLQSYTLLDAIAELNFDVCVGGGRRDEDKARAKERIFSIRNKDGGWDPYCQRPELWNLYNGRINHGEHVRAFPISNWSELDIWNYIAKENINLPSIYFPHERDCILHNNKLIAISDFITIDDNDVVVRKKIRYRTVGDMTCTAAIESEAETVDKVILEIQNSAVSERGETRMDDGYSEAAMEDRKLKGYF